jgi:type VI secretion system secreted protein VgrG
MQAEQVGLSKTVMVGNKFSITVGDEFEVKVGKSTLVMKSDGSVSINGVKFNFEASGPVQISGKDVDVN